MDEVGTTMKTWHLYAVWTTMVLVVLVAVRP